MHFKKGVSALVSMVALGAIIMVVTGTTIWVENNRTTNYSSDVNSSNIMAAAEGALQDALLKLNLKTGATNYSLIINGITVGVCYYADSPSAGTYTIRTNAIKGNTNRAMKALVNKDLNTLKFHIYSKEEDLDSICVATAATVPGVPLNPIWVSSASGQVTINWSAPTSNGDSSITNYKVYRGVTTGGETLLTTLGNTLSYLDTGLTDNANYYYKVSAVNAVGEGALSSEVLAIPGQTPVASAVTVSNYAFGNYVGATYQISTNFTSNNTGLSCDYSTNGGTTWTGATLSGTLPNYNCLKTGVTALDNIGYSITMRMTNIIGANVATAIAKTGDTVGPTVADNWTNNWTATTSVTVTLTPTDAKSGVASTKYCVDTTNTCNPSTGTVGTSVSVTCTAGTVCTQYVRYAAWDYVNNASAVYTETVRQDTMVPVDGTLIVTPGSYQNTLSWSGFSDSGSGLAAANTYKVVYLTTGSPAASCTTGTQAYLGTATSFIHTSLTGGTTYYYRICAYDAVGNISTGATNSGIPTTTTTTTLPKYCDNDADGHYAKVTSASCSGSYRSTIGDDCNDACATCYPGSTAYTTSPDGLDQDCDGTIDEISLTICTPTWGAPNGFGYDSSCMFGSYKQYSISLVTPSAIPADNYAGFCTPSGTTCTGIGGYSGCTASIIGCTVPPTAASISCNGTTWYDACGDPPATPYPYFIICKLMSACTTSHQYQ